MKNAVALLSVMLAPALLPGATGYLVHNLVSDQPGQADFTDPNAVNVWGVVASATSPFWVCAQATGISPVYTVSNSPTAAALGAVSTLKPNVPGAGSTKNGPCTGIVANTAGTTNFRFGPNQTSASFIFVTEDGTLSAWANAVDPANAVLQVDNSKTAAYTGLAIVATPTPLLFAASLRGGIDVFDTNFKPVTLATGAFTDPAIPAGYAPFNIWNIGGKLYVTYAKQNDAKNDYMLGPGLGYVDVYDTTGKLLQHLINGGTGSPLNGPWGIALAPATFGQYANDLLVGNFGDGTINAFDPATGKYLGTLQDGNGKNIVIPGLWGMVFGNGANGGDKDALYFGAGPAGEAHGLFGSIQANPVVAASDVTSAAQPTAGIAPNSYITIKGSNLAATKRLWATADFKGNNLPSALDGVTVTMNGAPAFVYYISPNQINALAPADLPTSGNVQVQVSNNGLTSANLSVPVQAVAPAFFLPDGTHIAARHLDYSLVGTSGGATPAVPGETIILYGNGFGATNPAAVNGQVLAAPAALVVPPVIMVNNTPATVLYGGLAGTGLYQFNVTLPKSLPDGDAQVSAQAGGRTSPAGTAIAIKNP